MSISIVIIIIIINYIAFNHMRDNSKQYTGSQAGLNFPPSLVEFTISLPSTFQLTLNPQLLRLTADDCGYVIQCRAASRCEVRKERARLVKFQ